MASLGCSLSNLRFDIHHVPQFRFCPYPVEVADNYLEAAAGARNGQVRLVLSALSVEILLKSFLVSPKVNVGEMYEEYEGERGHDLRNLFDRLPEELRKYLLQDNPRAQLNLKILTRERDVFVQQRYYYEAGARQTYNDLLFSLASKMIERVVWLYWNRGCEDPYILEAARQKSWAMTNQ